jgi:hypothetical protein
MDQSRTRLWMPSRRQVIATGASALALSSVAGFAPPLAVARGSVFADEDGSGVRRPGSRGLPDVLVSNGRDVVRTDAEGRWALPVPEGDSVFVIKPAGWSTPVNAHGLPRFFHLHHPAGSAQHLRYAGLAPTGALPASIDFALRREGDADAFEAILVSDTQPENEMELGYLRDDILVGMIGSGAAFVINHGDVVADDLSLYPRYLELLRATGLTWHHCAGNHDLNFDVASPLQGRETWKRTFGPPHYAFQHGQATFIVLDNVHYSGRGPQAPDGGRYAGRIGVAQLKFVRNLLAQVPREHLIVVSMHIPLVAKQGDTAPGDHTADRRALLALLSERPHTLSLSGHMHTTEHHYLGADMGFAGVEPHHHHVLTAACGSWWCGPRDRRGIPSADSVDGTPNGFHILSVEGNRYTTRFMPATGKGDAQLRISVVRGGTGCRIVANVFDGGPRTTVTCEIAGILGAEPMQRLDGRDPFLQQVFNRADAVRKPWVAPVESTHVWGADLVHLPATARRVTVRARDEYGRAHVAYTVLDTQA